MAVVIVSNIYFIIKREFTISRVVDNVDIVSKAIFHWFFCISACRFIDDIFLQSEDKKFRTRVL